MSTYRLSGVLRAVSTPAHFSTRLTNYFLEYRQVHFSLLALFALLVLFAKLHIGDLGGYDDAVYAHEGKQMLATGEWWNVMLNGRPDFDKPPLFVWLEALSMALFGVSDFAARFPAALLGFGTLLLVYLVARELSDSYWLPIWAMMILFSTHFFMRFAMRAMTDVPFAFFFTLALLFYLKGLRRHSYFVWCGLAISLAVLLRSFLGWIPVSIIFVHLAVNGRLGLLRNRAFQLGLLLAFGLPLVWFASQYWLYGNRFLALHFSFTVENLMLTKGKDTGQFFAGLLQYPVMLSKTYWPWLPLLLAGLWLQARQWRRAKDSTSSFLLLWVLGVLIPFSIAGHKWLRYLMPIFPAFAILAAMALDRLLTAQRRGVFLQAAYAVFCLALLGLAFNPKYRVRPEEIRRLAPVAAAATHPARNILLYTEKKPRDAHMFQVIWYADRNCDLLADYREALARLEQEPEAAVIMDKAVFQRIESAQRSTIQVLGETEGFVCWIKSNGTELVTTRPPNSSQPSQANY
jgi:4-amino-4-deoxy-L-arabinose transferase-like glycosyltransferase